MDETGAILAKDDFTRTINVKDAQNNVDSNAYSNINSVFSTAMSKIGQLENYVKDACFTTSSTTLGNIGSIQQDIAELNKSIENKKHDVDVAESRHNSVVKSHKSVSDYQGISARLGFIKPIHTTSVSILIGLGIFLTLASVYVAYTTFGSNPIQNNIHYSGLVANFDKKAFMLGVGSVVAIVGILSYLGIYGHSQM